jgi:hypothetical protein
VQPSSIVTSLPTAEFTPISILAELVLVARYFLLFFFYSIEISGQFFHRPNIVRIDSEHDDVDILKQSVISSTNSVCASVKVPLYPGSWMLKVRATISFALLFGYSAAN